MSKVTERFETITRVRSYFYSSHDERVETKEGFTENILKLLNEGFVDMDEVEQYRFNAATVVRLNMVEEKMKMTLAAKFWRTHKLGLADMQFSIKPICSREFCLRSLAMASDMGANVRQIFHAPRIDAILLGLHDRAGEKSELHKLNPETVEVIIEMALRR